MKLGDIYRICVEAGIAADDRDSDVVERVLADAQAEFTKLDDEESHSSIASGSRTRTPTPGSA